MQVTGTFQIDMKPIEAYTKASEGASMGRMSIDKSFHGPLSAQSQGEMLSAMSPVKGSAGYVAIEKVVGSLEGKTGTFALQHFGTMQGTDSRLILEVVPDSGTGELVGLKGSMQIRVEEGQHYYDFEYSID